VKPAVPENGVLPIPSDGKRFGAQCMGAMASCWGRTWVFVLKFIMKQRLTHHF